MSFLHFFYSIKFLIALWFIIVYFLYLKWDKENKLAYKEKYYSEPPSLLSPAQMKALASFGRLYPRDIVAQTAQLILNGILVIHSNGRGRLKLCFNADLADNLSPADRLLLNMLSDIGGKNGIALSSLLKPKRTVLKKTNLRKRFDLWQKEVNSSLTAEKIYSPNRAAKAIGCFLSLVYTVLSVFLSLYLHRSSYLVLVAFAAVLFIYSINILRRSPKGQLQYAKYMSFKRYIKDINNSDNKTKPFPYSAENAEKCIPYAISLGVYNELADFIQSHNNENGSDNLKILKFIPPQELKTLTDRLIKAAELSLISVEYE